MSNLKELSGTDQSHDEVAENDVVSEPSNSYNRLPWRFGLSPWVYELLYEPSDGAPVAEVVFLHDNLFRGACVRLLKSLQDSRLRLRTCQLKNWVSEKDLDRVVTPLLDYDGFGEDEIPVILVGFGLGGLVIKQLYLRAAAANQEARASHQTNRSRLSRFLLRVRGVFTMSDFVPSNWRCPVDPSDEIGFEVGKPDIRTGSLSFYSRGHLNQEIYKYVRSYQLSIPSAGDKQQGPRTFHLFSVHSQPAKNRQDRDKDDVKSLVVMCDASTSKVLDIFCPEATIEQISSKYLMRMVQKVKKPLHKSDDEEPVPLNTLRSDVADHGFEKVDAPFRPGKVVFLFRSPKEDKDAVEMVFLHPEGSATLFGVGIRFAKVYFKDSTVVLKEIQESTWRDYWSETSRKQAPHFHVMLLEFGSEYNTTARTQSHKPVLDVKAGKEGTTRSKPVDWIRSFFRFLRGRIAEWNPELGLAVENNGANNQDSEDGSSGSESSSQVSIHTLSGREANQLPSSSQIVPSHDHDQISESQQQPRMDGGQSGERGPIVSETPDVAEMTVTVYLDPAKRSFYSPEERADLIVDWVSDQLQISPSSDPIRQPVLRIHGTDTEFSVPDVDGILESEMETEIIFTFSASKGPTGRYGCRKIKSKININFHMAGSTEDPNLFGWYQNQLHASFECKENAAARRWGDKSTFGGLLSEHETRYINFSHANETSRANVTGTANTLGAQASISLMGILEFMGWINTHNETSDSSNRRRESTVATQMPMECLKGTNYCVNACSRSNKIGFTADLYSSPQSLDVWGRDREMAENNGMMSDVSLSFEGQFAIPPDRNNLGNNGICEWELCSSRQQKMLQRLFLPDTKLPVVMEHCVEDRVKTPFYLNHYFSPEKFSEVSKAFADDPEWHMAGNTLVPPPLEVVLSNDPALAATPLANNTD